MRQCGEVKQVKHVDFEDLKAADIVKSVIELCLLAAKVGPKRKLIFILKVLYLKCLQLCGRYRDWLWCFLKPFAF